MKTEIELGNSTKKDQWKNSQGKEAENEKVIGLPENPFKKKATLVGESNIGRGNQRGSLGLDSRNLQIP